MKYTDQGQILSNSASKLDLFCNGTYDVKHTQTDIIRLFHLYLSIYIRVFDSEDSTSGLSRLWNGLWASFTKAIQRYHSKSSWNFDKARPSDYWRLNTSDPTSEELFEADRILSQELLVTIYSYPAILAQRDDEGVSQIHPALIKALLLFVPVQERTLLYERFPSFPHPDVPPRGSPEKRTREEKKQVAGEEAKSDEKVENTGTAKHSKATQKKRSSSTKRDDVQ